MKKYVVTILFILTFINHHYGQQLFNNPLLDTGALKSFSTLFYSHYIVSNDGKFISYDQANPVVEVPTFERKITLKLLDGKWETEMEGIEDVGAFTPDSKYFIFKKKINS
jgi:hypothetical protein